MDRITDYATLVLAVNELVNAEISSSLDVFIQSVESDVGRKLDSTWQEVTEELSVLRDGVNLTDERRGVIRVAIDENPLERLHIDVAKTTYENWTPQQPLAYSVTGSSNLSPHLQCVRFWPLPPDDTSYQAEITYKLMVPPLTSGAPTNWLLSVAPDVYLYGTAAHAVIFNGDKNSLAEFERQYQISLAGLITEVSSLQSFQETISAPGAGGYENWLP